MNNPFHSENYDDAGEQSLVESARSGDHKALSRLLDTHRMFIYNVALKMLLDPETAEDVTQEVLIKVITNLATFRGESAFRTWLYRIVFNHILNLQKKKSEETVGDFESFGQGLDQIADHSMTPEEEFSRQAEIVDAQVGCMSAMLLCLDRRQRLVFILGEIFQVESSLGADFLETSTANFRQLLTRARKDLFQFMDQKCGLVNTNNPCRCHKKTKSFIEIGWVNPEDLKFNSRYKQRIQDLAPEFSDNLSASREGYYDQLFREHPFQEPAKEDLLEAMIASDGIKGILG